MNAFFIAAAVVSGICILLWIFKSPKGGRSFFLSALQGLAALFAVNLSGMVTGVTVALNYWTAGAAALLGLPGVICTVILNFIFNVF